MIETIKRLRAGETVELEGLRFQMDPTPFQAGDLYIGQRNTGPQLMTAKFFAFDRTDGEQGMIHADQACVGGEECAWVYPVELGYPYNLGETVKVREAE